MPTRTRDARESPTAGAPLHHGPTPNDYENILASLFDGVVVVSTHQVVTLFNRAAEDILGVRVEEASGMPLDSVFPGNDYMVEMVGRTLSSGRSHADPDVCFRTRDGRERTLGVTTAPLSDPEGRILGVVMVLRDLTKVRDMEEQIKRAERLSTLGVVAAGMAHEIKNPLGGIKGAAQLLRDELGASSSLRPYTEVISREVDRLDGIMEGLLAFARPKAVSYEAVNIHSVLDSVLLLQRRQAQERGVILERRYDPSLPPVLANEEQLVQVFLNLVRNAFDAMPEGGTLTVGTQVQDLFVSIRRGGSRTQMILVIVQDTGVGIPPEVQKDLFTPFFTTKARGVGLGLAISHQIVAEHQGTLRVASEPGRGTRMLVSLPAAPVEREAGE